MRCPLLACAILAGSLVAPPAGAQEAETPPFATQRPHVSQGVFVTRDYRNATFAAVASMVAPGGGQVYNDDMAKFLLAAAALGGSAALYFTGQDTTVRIAAASLFGVGWLWSVSDAYLSAEQFNRYLDEQALGD